ncbi:GIY-YIG nuclease family protein [Mesorhizobium sp. M1329]|uniref:GIY-YIG nuclease family protein n=1 Tax=Mesorhizobium sp. M1329 TaxID=2957083 RepID=UPI00333D3D5E
MEMLVAGGFEHVGSWILSPDQRLVIDRDLPKAVGVYAFAMDDIVLYVGVATMGLAKRLYFYGRPGVSQRTSLRINATMISELATRPKVDVYAAFPPDMEWNGLPVHGSAGLELGLIKKYALPWNMRSAR